MRCRYIENAPGRRRRRNLKTVGAQFSGDDTLAFLEALALAERCRELALCRRAASTASFANSWMRSACRIPLGHVTR